MPYIPKAQRPKLDELIEGIDLSDLTEGDLNYLITKVCLKWIGEDEYYQYYNTVMGVLECVKQELYRRRISPFEDRKCTENGDVYGI